MSRYVPRHLATGLDDETVLIPRVADAPPAPARRTLRSLFAAAVALLTTVRGGA